MEIVWPSTLVTVMLAVPAAKEGVRQVTVALGETRRVTVQFTPVAVIACGVAKKHRGARFKVGPGNRERNSTRFGTRGG